MSVFRPRCEYLEKENLIDIEDYLDAVRNTEDFRATKVKDMRREHELIVRRIRKIKKSKRAYIRRLSILPKEDDTEDTMPVDYFNEFDTPNPELALNRETNIVDMIRNPTNQILNYTRDRLRRSIYEIDGRIRDYDYQLLKLQQMEQRLTYLIGRLLKLETTARELQE